MPRMTSLDFHHEKAAPKSGMLMQFAIAYFGGILLSPDDEQRLIERFRALRSCAKAEFIGSGKDFEYSAIINAVRYGQPHEADFIADVTACAKEYYGNPHVTFLEPK